MGVEREFEMLAGRVGSQQRVTLTPRELVHMVGAQRRGAQIVDEIRSRLARHKLATDPDFAEVHADDSVEIVPTDGHQPPFLASLEAAAKQLATDASAPKTTTVRSMLSWFGAQRRSPAMSDTIRATLAGFDLETDPDFQSVHVDEEVRLVKRADQTQAHDDPPADRVETATDNPPAPETPPAPDPDSPATQHTFHVGTLDEANRTKLVSAKPQTSLREAMSQMLVDQVSYLPILANEHRATGLVRWKDIGRYLLLHEGAKLDDPVENASVDPVIVSFERPFLEVIPLIIQQGCILVRGPKGRITGLITKKDLGKRLLELTAPFVTLGEIERGIRQILDRGDFSASELRELALDANNPREVKGSTDLTLGEFQRLLQRKEAWDRLRLQVDRATFIRGMDEVRLVRNSVMHFDPEGPSDADRKRLASSLDCIYAVMKHADA